MAQIKTVTYVCDNPECNNSETVMPGGTEFALGVHVDTVTIHDRAGGMGAKGVYACSLGCLADAVAEAVDRG